MKYPFIVHKGQDIYFFCTSLADAKEKREMYIRCLINNSPISHLLEEKHFENILITEVPNPFTRAVVEEYINA